MRAVIQRVKSSSVTVENETVGKIGKGLLVLLGIAKTDKTDDVKYLADKIVNLRIFEDENRKMNCSLMDMNRYLNIAANALNHGTTVLRK